MNEEQFTIQSIKLRNEYQSLEVMDDESFVGMGSYESTAKDAIAAIKAHMKPQIEDAHKKHKKLTVLQKKLVDPFEEVRSGARSKRLEYQQEQARIAQELADKEAAALAEQKKQNDIKEAELLGTTEDVTEAKTAPVEKPIVEAAPTVKVSGARKLWSAEVTDIKKLLKGIIEGTLSADLVEPNMVLLNCLAVKHKENFNVPGVKAVSRLS